MNHKTKLSVLFVAVTVLVAPRCAEAAHNSVTEFEAECRAFVELANSTFPSRLPVDYDYEGAASIRPKFAHLPAIARRIRDDLGVLYRHIDVDGDGLPDHVAVTTGGTAHIEEALVIATSAPTAELHLAGPEDDRVGWDVELIRINGRYFFLAPVEDDLTLWTVRDGQFQQVCVISPDSDRMRLVESTDELCDKAGGNGPDYITYPAEHSLTELPNEGRFWSWYPISGLARIDIDNDGTLDGVTRIRFSSGAGRGCEKTYVAVVDKSLSSVPENSVNHRLEEIEGHCGPDMKLFTYEGRTYLESTYDDGRRTIGFFDSTRYQQVCAFETVRSYKWTH
jgi:hypothetical protein